MPNIPSSTPPEPMYLEIEVTPNDDDDTVETNLRCALNHCGKTVSIDCDGPKTVQNISCKEHGFLGSFPHQIALSEFVRVSANKVLATSGHKLIDSEAAFIVGDEPPRPEKIN